MNQIIWNWLAGSLILAGAYGCKSSQSSEELRGEPGGRQNELGTCIAVCKTNDFFDCGTVATPLTEKGCKNFKLPAGEAPIPSFVEWRWVAGGDARPRGGMVVDAPGGDNKTAIIEKSELVCPLSRSEKLYFDKDTLMLYLDDFSKPSDFVASVKVNKGRNMDPYSFAFSASGKMKYGGVVKNPKFPGKSSFILLELETPIKRSVPCHEINRDADVPQPAVGLPVFIDPVHEPAQGLPLPAN